MPNFGILVFITGIFVVSNGDKILLVFSFPGQSHAILGNGYVDNLLEAGHQVTIITPYPKKNPAPNLTQIDVSVNMQFHFGRFVTIENVMDSIVAPNSKHTVFSALYEITRSTVESESVQRLLKDPQQRFEFSAVFNCPYIWAVSMNPSWLALQLVEAAGNPEYYPDTHSANFPPFSYTTKLKEVAYQVNDMVIKNKYAALERQLYEDNIVPILKSRGRHVPSFEKLVYNASLLIVNSHSALAQVMPLPPNCVTVGGYHISPRIPPLSEDLQKLMDAATDGVIYFSMGTVCSSETFPKTVIQGLLDMFKELKQVVLWKFNAVVPNLPRNVHVLPWAPQQSIINHPNCVLFITHGGYLSLTEAVHFRVPLVAIPVFADQFANAARLELRGIGRKVDLTYNLVKDLKAAIRETIGNPRYKANVERLSSIYHDQKSPRKKLVDWVEYVIRSRGAAHLRSPALLVPWYQQVYLDLLVLIVLVIITLLWILIMLLRCLFINI